MGGTQRLPRTVGIGRAKELIYSARRIDAAEALRIGLVNAVHPAGELPARALELAQEIAANAPLAVEAAKRAIDGTYWRDREAWLDWEATQAAAPLTSEDRRAGMAAAERKAARPLRRPIGHRRTSWHAISTISATGPRSGRSRPACTPTPCARTASARPAGHGSAR